MAHDGVKLCAYTSLYLELCFAPLTGKARTLNLQQRLSVSVLDRKGWVDEGAVLLDPAYRSSWRRLDLQLLQATEAAPASAAVWTYQMDDLHNRRNTKRERERERDSSGYY